MSGTPLRISKFAAAIAFAFVLLGLGAQFASAGTYDSGPARTPEEEKAACGQFGGTWTTEHNGSVGICTYPNGEQDRCRFKTTGRCSITFRSDDSNPVDSKGSVNNNTTGDAGLSEGGATGGTTKAGAVKATTGADKKSNSD